MRGFLLLAAGALLCASAFSSAGAAMAEAGQHMAPPPPPQLKPRKVLVVTAGSVFPQPVVAALGTPAAAPVEMVPVHFRVRELGGVPVFAVDPDVVTAPVLAKPTVPRKLGKPRAAAPQQALHRTQHR